MKNKSLFTSLWFIFAVDILWLLMNLFLFQTTQHSIHAYGCVHVFNGGGCLSQQSSPVMYWILSNQLYLVLALLAVIIPMQLALRKRLVKVIGGASLTAPQEPNPSVNTAKLLYGEKGGARIGTSFWRAANASYPLAKIEVYDDLISLSVKMIINRVDFKKTEVTAVCAYKGLFSQGIKIEHTKNDVGPFVVFWSFKTDKLLNKLRKAGYPAVIN